MRNFVYAEVGFLGHKIAATLGVQEPLQEANTVHFDDLSEFNKKIVKKEIFKTLPIDTKLCFESVLRGRDNLRAANDLPDGICYMTISDVSTTFSEHFRTQYWLAFTYTFQTYDIVNKNEFFTRFKQCTSFDYRNQSALFDDLTRVDAIRLNDTKFNYTKPSLQITVLDAYTNFEFKVGCAAIALAAVVAVGLVLYLKPDLLKNLLQDTKVSSSVLNI